MTTDVYVDEHLQNDLVHQKAEQALAAKAEYADAYGCSSVTHGRLCYYVSRTLGFRSAVEMANSTPGKSLLWGSAFLPSLYTMPISHNRLCRMTQHNHYASPRSLS